MMALLLKEQSRELLENAFTVGSLVYVTCYGPCWGLRGIICAVDVIDLGDAQEALYFYLVALQEGQIKEPVWFVHDDVAAVEGDSASLWHSGRNEEPRLGIESLNVFEREQDSGLEALSISRREVVAV